MLELIFLWAVSALALGFAATLAVLFVRQMLCRVGRIVFFDSHKTCDAL